MASLAAIDDVRLCAGLYDIREAARLIDLPEQTFRRWARELKRQFGAEYVLMAPELATDGVDLLWDFSRTKAEEGTDRSTVWSARHPGDRRGLLTYLTFGEDNLPESLRLQAAMPSEVVVSPRHMFGQPVFVKSGACMADIVNMIKAGETSETVAAEHGVTVEDVRTAARVLLGHAA
jgi:uncharacterized protein (DUF433 family)